MSEALDLLRVLSAAVGEELAWDRVLLLYNVGPLRPTGSVPAGSLGGRGCNALILDRTGTPRLYCKLRPEVNAEFAAEARVLQRLAGGRGGLVPETHVAVGGGVRITTSEFREGVALCRRIPRIPGDRWNPEVSEVLGRLEELLTTRLEPPARVLLPPAEQAAVVEANLGVLVDRAGADAGILRLVELVRDAPPLPAVPQHGDLWCGNVLRGATGWTVVDFEWCGRIVTPLHDTFHLLRTCWDWRKGSTLDGVAPWIERLDRHPEDGARARRIIAARAAARGMDEAQVGAAFISYAAEMASRLVQRGWTERTWAAFVREVEAAAAIAGRAPLASVLLPGGAEVASRAEPSPTPPGSPS